MNHSAKKEAGMKRGFTLIELLVVITILAILAGAALPYVQSYVAESKTSKAKADLEEIGRALSVYEMREGVYNASDVSQLTGRYLNKAPIDPWGRPYVVATSAGVVYTCGADRLPVTSDDISYNYQPPLSLVQVKWVDRNQSGAVDKQNPPDQVQLIFSRKIKNSLSDAFMNPNIGSNFQLSSGTAATSMDLAFKITPVASITSLASTTIVLDVELNEAFTPGSDTIMIRSTHSLQDLAGNLALASQAVTILPQ